MYIEDRRVLRVDLLGELYDYHFENGGEGKSIREVYMEDTEKKLAYRYLADRGLISLLVDSPNARTVLSVNAKISFAGIDLVENDRLKKMEVSKEIF